MIGQDLIVFTDLEVVLPRYCLSELFQVTIGEYLSAEGRLDQVLPKKDLVRCCEERVPSCSCPICVHVKHSPSEVVGAVQAVWQLGVVMRLAATPAIPLLTRRPQLGMPIGKQASRASKACEQASRALLLKDKCQLTCKGCWIALRKPLQLMR